jgi:ATP-dependent RNA helicase DDX35
MTEGILLRELHSCPLLTKYSVIILDEAHERSVNTDILLGVIRRIIKIRIDLRVIIMSATADAELFRDFFEMNEGTDESKNTSIILSVEGRMFPVSVFYTKVPVPNYVKATIDTCINIHKTERHGDILAFLTGQDEVEQVCAELIEASRELKGYDRMCVLPLYSGLSQQQQIRVFDSASYGTRKIIVSTNIAETSVTIPGICYGKLCFFRFKTHF